MKRILCAMMVGLLAVGMAERAEAAPKQMPITFGGYSNRTEVLTNFPVLVVLSNGVGGSSGFTFADFVTTNGYDLRFVTNATDSGYSLNYEIESWNTNAGQASYVWVQIPTIPTNGSGFIYARWGDTATSNQLACTSNGVVWSNGFVAVWHMGQTNAVDSAKRGHDGAAVGSVINTVGKIGNGNDLDASADYITVPGSSDFTISGDFSMSLWLYGHGMANYEGLMGTYDTGFIFARWNDAANSLAFWNQTWAGSNARATTDNAWHLVAYTRQGTTTRFYVDGVNVDTQSGGAGINCGTKNLNLGNFGPSATSYGFDGILDEARIENVLRSTNWMWACYLNQASNTVFNNYGTMMAAPPAIQNQSVTAVTTNSATFNGTLTSTGSSSCAVCVLWGTNDGGSVWGAWANTNWFNDGAVNAAWTNNTPFSTNLTLGPGATYYYTYGVSNATANVVASRPQNFITGVLTVQASDPTGRTNASDTAAFTVTRPETSTNEDLVVNYALGGTAINGAYYSIAPASGTVAIAKGQTNGVITVTPVYRQSVEQSVILTLLPGPYATGTPNAATCTLAMVTGPDRYWVSATPGNWSDTANWSYAPYGPGGWSVPASTNNAIFDGGGSGYCSLNAAVNVLGLRLESGFSGAVIQTTNTVTIGSNGYYQAGGVFAGGSTNILIYYSSTSVTNTLFTLAGGVFTNTSGKLSLYRDGNGTFTEFVFTNGDFYHNNGTLGFDSWNTDGGAANVRTVRASKPLTLKHLSFGRGNSYSGTGLRYAFDLTGGGDLIVEGDFNFNPQYYVGLNSGTIKARGNVAVGAKAVGVAATLLIDGTGDQTYTSSGSGTWPFLTVAKPSGSFAPLNPTDTNVVLKVPRFTLSSGTFTAPAGRMDVSSSGGSTTNFSFTNGTFNANGGKLRFADYQPNGGAAYVQTIYLRKPLTLQDLTYDGGNSSSRDAYYTLDIAGEGSLLVGGNFAMKYNDPTAGYGLLANGGTIEVQGNVAVGTDAKGGTTQILLSGTNTQNVLHAAGIPPRGNWTVNKTGGAMMLASNLSLAGTSQDLVWTNGAITLSTNVLTVGRNVSVSTGATALAITIADATTAGRLMATGTVSGLTNIGVTMTMLATLGQVNGQTYTILSNSTSFGSATLKYVSWPGLWTGDVSYAASGGKVVTISNIRQQAAGDAPTVLNLPATNVTTGGAAFNGLLVTNGGSSARVFVLWDQTNASVSGAWANTNSWNTGDWPDGSYPTTNLTLTANRNYFYTFGAANLGGQTVYPDAQYLITGPLTVSVSDPTGRVNAADTAAFTVTRPDTCTNDDLLVNYTLGGTAVKGTDYTIAPASGAVVIAKGQTNGVITVTPVYRQGAEQNVILTLVPGPYAPGTPNAATCTLAMVDGPDRYWVSAAAGNWNDTNNWSYLSAGPGGSSVPGAGNNAIFDGGGQGNCTLDGTVNVLGFRITPGYAGTVAQTTYTVTIGSNGYYQAGGVFAGGSTNILIYYSSASVTNTLFTLAGGVFTNTSGKLSLYRDQNGTFTEFVFTNGDFYHNNGTLGFDSQNGDGGAANVRTVRVSKPLTLKHLSFGRGNSYSETGLRYAFDLTGGGDVIVGGDFNFNPQYYVGLNSGTIKARGNVAVGAKSIGVAATLLIDGTGDQTYTSSNGTWPYLTVSKPSGTFAPSSLTDTNIILKVPRFALAGGTFVAPAGRLDLAENGDGSVTLFSYTNGTFDANNGTVRLASQYTSGAGWAPVHTVYLRKPLTLKALDYYGGRKDSAQHIFALDIAGEGDLTVGGALTMGGGSNYYFQATGGTIRAQGSVTLNTGASGGSTRITLCGTNDQTVTQMAGTPPQGQWTIDKSGGTVVLATNLSLSGTSQDLVWTNGALNLSSNTLTVGRNVSIASGAGTLGVTVADAAMVGRLIATGTVSGIDNAQLEVTVSATPSALQGQSYMVLSNSTPLTTTFESAIWIGNWYGRVDYTRNAGKQATLFSISRRGTLFTIR